MGRGNLITAGTRPFTHGVEHVAQVRALMAGGERAVAGPLLATHGNRFQLLEGADEFIPSLVADIRSAQHQVNFSTYALHPGLPGGHVRQVTDALIERARAGVAVTAIVDQVGTGLLLPGAKKRERLAFLQELRDNGVGIVVKKVTPGRGGLDDVRFAVDHRKLYEIDGTISYQGGMNLVDAWLPWHDVMVRAEGPTSAQAGAVLAARYRDLGGTVAPARAALLEEALRRPVDDAYHATELLTTGSRSRRDMTEAFIADVQEVTRSTERGRLWVANPYLADPQVMNPVVDAARAGHDVRLTLAPKVVGGAQAQDVFTDPLRRAWAYEVANAGGTVILVPEFSHAKVWLAQRAPDAPTKASVGAFNLDLGSTKRNYENGLRTTDPGLVTSVEGMFLSQQGRGIVPGDDVVAGWEHLARWRERLNLRY